MAELLGYKIKIDACNDPAKVISIKVSKGIVLLEVEEVIVRVITLLWYYLWNWYDSSMNFFIVLFSIKTKLFKHHSFSC